MWANCPLSASSVCHAEFHEGCFQKQTNPLNCTTGNSDISGTTRNFTKDTALSDNGRGAAWHGRGTAWARQECGMACVK
jgi:hypothetical protein